jgi:hypothetical protein
VEGEVDWAMSQPRPRHTAKVSHNLLETAEAIRFASCLSRSSHIRAEVSEGIESKFFP